jgi:MFS family permease
VVRPLAERGPWVFKTILAGQVVSLFGSNLTSFVLGVWVFQKTGSATQFSLIAFFSIIPEIVLAPLTGTLVDRWNRRTAMILSDSGAALGTVALAALLWADRLEIWHIYVVVLLGSVFESFQAPAFQAAVPQLMPKKDLVRANSMVAMSTAGAAMIAPLTAGALLDLIDLWGVILIDLGTFVFAVVALLLVRIPAQKRSAAGSIATKTFLEEFSLGWRFVRPHAGFIGLLLFFAAVNFYMGIIGVLLTPLILGFASATALGIIMSFGSTGFLVGSVALSAWGGPKRKIRAICLFFLLQGAILFCGGLQPSVALVATAAFVFSFCSPILTSCTQAIWQSKVPIDLQGRVYAVRRIVAWSTLPVAYLSAGPLADRIFEPMMAPGGLLADSVGRLIGTGQGRGVGLLFIVLGLAVFGVVIAAYSYGPLRRLEDEIPDAIPDHPDDEDSDDDTPGPLEAEAPFSPEGATVQDPLPVGGP